MRQEAWITVLWSTVASLMVIGLLEIYGVHSAENLNHHTSVFTTTIVVRQALTLLFVLGLALVWWSIPFKWWYHRRGYVALVTLFLLFLPYIPGIGRCVNGAQRWVRLGPLVFQPSEWAKLWLPVWLLFDLHGMGIAALTWKRLLKCIMLHLPYLLCIALAPDNRTTFLLLCFYGCTLFCSGVALRLWLFPALGLCALFFPLALSLPYVQKRIESYRNPTADLLGAGHQPYQAKIAIGSGGVWGKGFGNSWQKYSFLPEAQNDYIVAIWAEEMGFVGVLLLIVAYLTLGLLGFIASLEGKNRLEIDAACLLTLIMNLQALLNLGVVSGILPSTGLSLPFVSAGGSALLIHTLTLVWLAQIKVKGCDISSLQRVEQGGM